MSKLSAIAAILLVAGAPLAGFAQGRPSPEAAPPATNTAPGKLSDQQIKTTLEGLGYTQVKDINPTPKGIVARAMKDGKPVQVTVDSAGKVMDERPD
jgi:hypothetical protein